MERARGLVGAVLFVMSCGAPTPQQYKVSYVEKRAELPNGLKLVVLPDDGTNLVEVDVRYQFGSNYDPKGMAGLAHLAEHMMFQHRLLGPKGPPTFHLLPQIAAGYFNAFTNWDSTHYMLNGRAEDLDGMLKIEAARMGKGCDSIPEAEFEREREVVRNEIRRSRDTPDLAVAETIMQAAYPDGHPYRMMIGGDDAQIANIGFADMCKFLETYYHPGNATVIVAGRVDADEVGKKVAAYFSGMTAKQSLAKMPVPAVKVTARTVTKKMAVEFPSVHYAWALPPSYKDEGEAAQLFPLIVAAQVEAFSDGQADKPGWNFARHVYGYTIGGAQAPLGVVTVELVDESKRAMATDFVEKAIKNAHRPFVSATSVEEKEAIARQKAWFIQTFEGLSMRTTFLGDQVQFSKRIDYGSGDTYWGNELARLGQLTGDRVRQVVKATANSPHVTVHIEKDGKSTRGAERAALTYRPKQEDAGLEPFVDPKEAHEGLAVPQLPSPLVNTERMTLKNGLQVMLLSHSKLPITRLQIVFKVGSAHDPKDRPGLADVTANELLTPANADVYDRIGAYVSSWVTDDTTGFTISGMDIYAPILVKALERYVRAGWYWQNGLERLQDEYRRHYQSARARQVEKTRKALLSRVLGESHPYAQIGIPDAAISRLNRDAAEAFRSEHYSAKNATLIVTGHFDAAAVKKSIEENFGEWDAGNATPPVTQAPAAAQKPRFVGVVGDPSPNVWVEIGFAAPAGIGGNEGVREVLAEVLNKQTSAVREKLGASYGVYAGQTRRLGPGLYRVFGPVDADRAGEALKALRAGIDAVRDGQTSDAVFAEARRKVYKHLLAPEGTSREMAARLSEISTHGLAADHYETLIAQVSQVTPAQVAQLAKKELPASGEVVVLLGDEKSLKRAFETAGIDQPELIR